MVAACCCWVLLPGAAARLAAGRRGHSSSAAPITLAASEPWGWGCWWLHGWAAEVVLSARGLRSSPHVLQGGLYRPLSQRVSNSTKHVWDHVQERGCGPSGCCGSGVQPEPASLAGRGLFSSAGQSLGALHSCPTCAACWKPLLLHGDAPSPPPCPCVETGEGASPVRGWRGAGGNVIPDQMRAEGRSVCCSSAQPQPGRTDKLLSGCHLGQSDPYFSIWEGRLFPGCLTWLQNLLEKLKQTDCRVSHSVSAAWRRVVKPANKTWEKPEINTNTNVYLH